MLGKGDLEFLHWAGRVGLCADLGQLRICGRCGSVMRVVISHSLRDGAAFRCSNGYCATKLSVRVDSWTWDMRLTLGRNQGISAPESREGAREDGKLHPRVLFQEESGTDVRDVLESDHRYARDDKASIVNILQCKLLLYNVNFYFTM